MKSLRVPLFWLSVLLLPGGFLLLAPQAVSSVRRARSALRQRALKR